MKYLRKITPVSSADGEGLESWLEDMALQGLYLKKFRPLFCTFTPGPAKKTRYRLEPFRLRLDDDLPRSMLELYQDSRNSSSCSLLLHCLSSSVQ